MVRIAAQPEPLRRILATQLPTKWGTFRTIGFERDVLTGPRRGEIDTAIAIILGDIMHGAPLLRIHSQCFTGELLGSLRCDCGEQLEIAMRAIAAEGRGLIIYEHQEGRGIGLIAKLQAYELQDSGLDTVDANRTLGFADDARDFGLPAAILCDLGVERVRLLSNNPRKSRALVEGGIEVVARIPCEAALNEHSLPYLRTKRDRMGHALSLGTPDNATLTPSPTITPTPTGKFKFEDQRRVAEPADAEAETHLLTTHNLPTLSAFSAASATPRSSSDLDAASPFASIEDAIRELQAGRMIVVVDDEDRENEGDLTMLAEMVTPEAINFMATHGRGLICLAMTGERLDELDLAPMTADSRGGNTALHGTAFTISIDAKGRGCTTGISAHDRAQTILTAIDASAGRDDLARPGHIFPLRARPGGVLERRGQTEAAVDLARLSGVGSPAGIICEIINDDGTMARVSDLIRFCEKHGLLMITVANLARHRLGSEPRRHPVQPALTESCA
jgi:3,4-dihydroxy-2-butanone 4-phosphate synthase/GTP cyclohydrolase II